MSSWKSSCRSDLISWASTDSGTITYTLVNPLSISKVANPIVHRINCFVFFSSFSDSQTGNSSDTTSFMICETIFDARTRGFIPKRVQVQSSAHMTPIRSIETASTNRTFLLKLLMQLRLICSVIVPKENKK